ARVDKELNSFIKGLAGANVIQRDTAKKLAGMPLHEQLAWISRNRKTMDRLADYLDDVMGNWTAFTRFERAFGPGVMFYPFVRMSFRWAFWSFPKRHPIRAQILYFLAQRHSEEIEKITGNKADWIDYAHPILFGEGGKPEEVLPIGHRLVPGLNAIVEAIGSDNLTGIFRSLNPGLSTLIYGGSLVDPMSGRQEQVQGD